MSRRTIGCLKRQLKIAASDLRKSGDSVTQKNLARLLDIPQMTLHDVLAYVAPHWRAELEIVDGRKETWNKTIVYNLYQEAAKVLLKDDHLPTPNNLGEKLKLTPGAIMWYMKKHADLAKKIGYTSKEIDSQVYHAGRKIRFRGEVVTRKGIAREAGVAQKSVWRVLKRHPDFLEKLALSSTFERAPSVNNGTRIPAWLKGGVRITNTTFPAAMSLFDRILTTVCERRGISREEMMRLQEGGTGHQKGYARNLVMYFLTEDAKLSPSEVAMMFGGRSADRVHSARKMILRDIERSCVQVELRALRNKIFRGYKP